MTRMGPILVLAATLALPVAAHHGFTGRNDNLAPIWIEGTVEAVFVGQQHPVVSVLLEPGGAPPDLSVVTDRIPTADPALAGTEVVVEFATVGVFFDLDGRVAIGDRVSVMALRNCDPPNQLRGQ